MASPVSFIEAEKNGGLHTAFTFQKRYHFPRLQISELLIFASEAVQGRIGQGKIELQRGAPPAIDRISGDIDVGGIMTEIAPVLRIKVVLCRAPVHFRLFPSPALDGVSDAGLAVIKIVVGASLFLCQKS